MKPLLVLLLLLAQLLPSAAAKPQPLEEIPGCTLVSAEWSDGDSFPVKTPSGETLSIRLYGVDCLELHARSETLQRRLREQRRHFGITEAGGTPQASIAIARDFAARAKTLTSSLLAKPFTVLTRRQDAMGDKRYSRIYAYITLAYGRDLSSELVRNGLARAFGYDSDHPNGNSATQMEELFRDLELVAAKQATGIWARTDWTKLLGEREAERREPARGRNAG